MSTQPIDYAALAEQARQQSAPKVDYAALAEQARSGSTAAPKPADDTGVMASLKRTTSGLAHLPGAVIDAFTKPPQNPEEEAVIGTTKGTRFEGDARISLALKRLIGDPMKAERDKAAQMHEQAKTQTDEQANNAYNGTNHLANMHAIAGYVPVLGPMAADMTQRYLTGDKSGAVTDLSTVVAGPKIAEGVTGAAKVIVPGAMRAAGTGLEKAAPYVGKGAKEAARFGGVGEFIHTGNPIALAGPAVAPLVEKGATAATAGIGRLIRRTGEGFKAEPKSAIAEATATGPVPTAEAPAVTPAPETPTAQPAEAAKSGNAELPRVNSGEGVLTQALTALDNKTLLKVAKSRGIDVTKEAQLKAGAANSGIIRKILDDFSVDELDEVRNKGIEIGLHKPVPAEGVTPEAGAEAWHYKVLNTFFPDVAVPKAMAARAEATIAARPSGAAVEAKARFEAARAKAEGAANAVPNDTPQFAYRVRDAGETGIDPKGHAQATLDLPQAQSYVEGRGNLQGAPQEVVKVDLSKINPKDYQLMTGPGGKTWVKFKSSVPESVIEKVDGEKPQLATESNTMELLKKSFERARAAKASK